MSLQVLGSVVAGITALVAERAQADPRDGVTNIDLFDDRKARDKGFDIIYEARDLDLPQSTRDGIDQFRGDISATKSRLAESTKRINDDLGEMVAKQYWTPAREELRRQLGNIRQDLNTLASQRSTKKEIKEAKAQAKAFITEAEKLDFAIRKKDATAASQAYASVKSALEALSTGLV